MDHDNTVPALPTEIWLHILLVAVKPWSRKDLFQCRRVCHLFHDLIDKHILGKYVQVVRAEVILRNISYLDEDNVKLLQWLHSQTAWTNSNVRNSGAFYWSMTQGYEQCRDWFWKTFDLSLDVPAQNYAILRHSAAAGALSTLKWLHEQFHFHAFQVCIMNNHALRVSVEGGHLETARWLQQTFQLTKQDALTDNNYVLRKAVENGDMLMCEWLQSTFQFTAEDVYSDIYAHYEYEFRETDTNKETRAWFTRTFVRSEPIKRVTLEVNSGGEMFWSQPVVPASHVYVQTPTGWEPW